MTDELVRGIRRIVGDQDEKPTGLEEAEARKAIGISRGVGLVRSDGSVAGSGGEGGGNDTSPPNVPVEDPDEGSSLPGDGGNAGGGNDSGTKTLVNGDAADVYDGVTGGSQTTQITGTDPDSANFTTVNFGTLDGIEYTPPDGWDNPDVGPAPEGWTEGFWWLATNGVFSGVGAFPQSAADDLVNNLGASRFSIQSGPTYIDDDTYSVIIYDNITTNTTPFTIFRQDCNISPSGFCSLTIEDVAETTQPSDGTCEVAYDASEEGYKGSSNDPDCSTDQKTASSFVIIRSQSDPSRYFRYTRLKDGGTKVTEVDSGGVPKPGTVTKIMDGSGNVVGFVDVSLDNFYQ